MFKNIIEIETLHAGEPCAYADSIYEAYISCRVEGSLLPRMIFYLRLTEEKVKGLTQLFIHPFDDIPTHAFSPRLTLCKPIGPSQDMIDKADKNWKPDHDTRWHVKVEMLFTD